MYWDEKKGEKFGVSYSLTISEFPGEETSEKMEDHVFAFELRNCASLEQKACDDEIW